MVVLLGIERSNSHATDIKIGQKNPNNVHIAGCTELDGNWGNGGMLYTKDGGTTWSKDTLPPLQEMQEV